MLARVGADGTVAWKADYDRGWDWPNAAAELSDGSIAAVGVNWGGDPSPDAMDLWVTRVPGDGQLPAVCSFAKDIAMTVTDSNLTVTATTATGAATTATPADTSAVVETTSVGPRLVCN